MVLIPLLGLLDTNSVIPESIFMLYCQPCSVTTINMTAYWPSYLFVFFFLIHKNKQIIRVISSHLDQTDLVNKGFIIWPKKPFSCRNKAGNPVRGVREFFFSHLSSQSECSISFIYAGLPTHRVSHKITIKLVITWIF